MSYYARLLSIALLAATLSAQQSVSFVDRYDTRSDSTVRLIPGVYIVDPPSMASTESQRGPSPSVTSAPATSFDNNGALEAFYRPQDKTYYWYSPQQENTMREIAINKGLVYFRKTIRVKGIKRSYTEITHTKKPSGYWPDYRLVTVSKGGAN